ncbi:MAG: hypothetical protein GX907_04655 [Clostridiaceae bacterium]|nr:hypothetical protein [Clostridiaceae bacterium]
MSAFKAGFARSDVTPPNGTYMAGQHFARYSEGVADPLYASAVAVSDGENAAVIITMDFCLTTEPQTGALVAETARRTGLPANCVFAHCTHTHNGPSLSQEEAYADLTIRKIADTAKAALDDLTPARLAAASGKVPDMAFCRRHIMKDGTVKTNPRPDNLPDVVGPAAVVDDSLELVRIIREGAAEIVIVNFAIHPDTYGGLYISPDYPGYVVTTLEGALDNARCIFIDGAEGDVGSRGDLSLPIRKGRDKSKSIAYRIAGEVLRIYHTAAEIPADKVAADIRLVQAPSNRESDPRIVELARQCLEYYKRDYEEASKCCSMRKYEAARIVDCDRGPDNRELHITALRIGDIAFCGIEGEPFSELGQRIKAASPFGKTLCGCCVNGWRGYFPSDEAYEQGGYEVLFSYYRRGVGTLIIENALALLRDLYEK